MTKNEIRCVLRLSRKRKSKKSDLPHVRSIIYNLTNEKYK